MHTIPREDYRRLEEAITSDESPVGIDAKKTHIIILYMLEDIQQRLDRIEERLEVKKQSHP